MPDSIRIPSDYTRCSRRLISPFSVTIVAVFGGYTRQFRRNVDYSRQCGRGIRRYNNYGRFDSNSNHNARFDSVFDSNANGWFAGP